MKDSFRVMCLGDIVGEPGRKILKSRIPALRKAHNLDMVIANGENSAGGLGMEPKITDELLASEIDILTAGDHVWHKKEFRAYLDSHSSACIRPANYPEGAPGRGWTVWEGPGGVKVGVINLIGRVFFNAILDCPFRKADQILENELKDVSVIFCDLHAEATSEKMAMGRYLDGRVSCVFGTHTHVQTADNQILPGGSAYITDLGMCGSADSVIGMETGAAIARFKQGLPLAYKIGEGRRMLNGVIVEIDPQSGKATSIERIREVE